MRNEKALKAIERPHGPVDDFTKTLPFELLSSRQYPARVVVNCELAESPLCGIVTDHAGKKSMAMLVILRKAGGRTPTAR